MKFETQVDLAPRTTLGVGGRAAHYARVETTADLRAACLRARSEGLELRVLGGGSNIVVADAGFSGLVVEVALRGIGVTESEKAVDVRAAAGEPWDDFVAHLVEQNLQGLECLSGIPGRVGATPIQNVGAYGQDVSETIAQVVAFDTNTGALTTFDNPACHFAYRDSLFKTVSPGRYIVTEVTFRVTPSSSAPSRGRVTLHPAWRTLDRWCSRSAAPSQCCRIRKIRMVEAAARFS